MVISRAVGVKVGDEESSESSGSRRVGFCYTNSPRLKETYEDGDKTVNNSLATLRHNH